MNGTAAESVKKSADESVEQLQDPEWFRVHPLSPLVSGGALAFALAAFVLRVVSREAKDRDLSGSFLAVVVGCVVGVALAITGALYLSWRKRWFAVDSRYLYSRSGGADKSSTKTHLSAVVSVEIERSFLARLCGLSSVNVKVQDGEGVEISYVPSQRAHELRRTILAAGTEAQSPSNGASVLEDEPHLKQPVSERSGESDRVEGRSGEDAVSTPAKANSSRVSIAPRRVVNFEKLEHEASVIYSLDRKRSLVADALARVPLVVMVLVFLIVGVTVLVIVQPTLGILTLIDRGLISTILVIGAPVILGTYGLVRYLSRFFGTQVRYADGTISLTRGLFTEYSSMTFLDRTHWVELSQPVMWRGKGWWRLRIRSLAIEGDEENEDGAEVKPKEILLPVADAQETSRVLDLFESNLGASGSEFMAVACREQDLTFRTSTRTRLFNPITFGHEGVAFVGQNIAVRTGRFSTKLVIIPFRKIQEVKIEQGPLQRVLGLGTVAFDGAGDVGRKGLGNLDAVDARKLFDTTQQQISTPLRISER